MVQNSGIHHENLDTTPSSASEEISGDKISGDEKLSGDKISRDEKLSGTAGRLVGFGGGWVRMLVCARW